MYLLDTNIISEMRKAPTGRANFGVQSWSTGVDAELMFLSAVSVMEMEIGILRKRRNDGAQAALLERWLHGRVLPNFAGRILPVDIEVALRCAAMHVPVSVAPYDSLIAATAMVHGMTVVTRNEKDFAPMGVRVLNPWVD